MAASSSLSLAFTLSHLLIILHLVEGQANLTDTCSREFECKPLGNTLSFPFTDSHRPGCGPWLVDCDKQNPQIKLWGEPDFPEEDWLDFTMPSPTEIKISIPKDCFVFQNHPPPNSENILYTISPNLTHFLKCNLSSSENEIAEFLPHHGKFSRCEKDHKFTIYYNYSDNEILDYNGFPPPDCSIIELALKKESLHQEDQFFENLEEISVEWSDERKWPCYKCFNDSGECIVDQNDGIVNKVHCSNISIPNQVRGSVSAGKKTKVGLIVGGTGIVFTLIICGIMFIIWRRKIRNKDGTYLLSRNLSFNPSPRADVEVGSVRFGVPVYTYAELEKATASFDSANELGDGGFGIVYFGKLKDGREVAVKRLYEHNYKRMEHFMNEINILTSLRHPNLVSLYGCTSRRSRELLLVYEYVPNGTVADHIHGSKAEERLLTWPMRMNVAVDTANALAYLHKSEIIHRDVKTNNILLDHNFSVKVADFGLSRLFPLNVTHVSTAPQGTPGYVDPDYHECYQLTVKSDVYSFGVVLIELISSLPAVDINRHRHEINLSNLAISRIQRNELDSLIDSSLGYGSDPEITRMTSSIAELAYRCLQVDKDVRPSMDEVLEILEAIKEGTNDPKSGVGISPSPESDDAVLLKNRKFPPSPVSVAEYCISGNSGCDSSSASV